MQRKFSEDDIVVMLRDSYGITKMNHLLRVLSVEDARIAGDQKILRVKRIIKDGSFYVFKDDVEHV